MQHIMVEVSKFLANRPRPGCPSKCRRPAHQIPGCCPETCRGPSPAWQSRLPSEALSLTSDYHGQGNARRR
eukprot:1371333-Heterocapsa_arctica.AAC.1